MRKLLAAAAVATLVAGSANAAVFSYSTDFSGGVGPEWSIVGAGVNSGDAGILGQLDGGTATLTRSSVGAGSGSLTFDLLGSRTIDGFNCCTDTFSLRINGALVFTGVFNMGGGGGETWTTGPGISVSGSGGAREITLGFDAVAGANTFAFSYGALQGFADEAWGLDDVSFSAQVADRTGVIPEPGTWALMILGFGGAGAALRRRRRAPSFA